MVMAYTVMSYVVMHYIVMALGGRQLLFEVRHVLLSYAHGYFAEWGG